MTFVRCLYCYKRMLKGSIVCPHCGLTQFQKKTVSGRKLNPC